MILAWRDSIHRVEAFSPESLVIAGNRTLEMRQNVGLQVKTLWIYFCISYVLFANSFLI